MANIVLDQVAQNLRYVDEKIKEVNVLIDFMKRAGKDTSSAEVQLKGLIADAERYRTALAESGINVPKGY